MKIRHLRKPEEFAALVKGGRKARSRTLTVYAGPNAPGEDLTVGIIISKKSIPKAVKRNYLRRVIYSYFRTDAHKWQKRGKVIVRVNPPGQIKGKRSLSRRIRDELDALAGNSRTGQ